MNRSNHKWSNLPNRQALIDSYKTCTSTITIGGGLLSKSSIPMELKSAVNENGRFTRGGNDDIVPSNAYAWGGYAQHRVGSSAYKVAANQLREMGYLRPTNQRSKSCALMNFKRK